MNPNLKAMAKRLLLERGEASEDVIEGLTDEYLTKVLLQELTGWIEDFRGSINEAIELNPQARQNLEQVFNMSQKIRSFL